jgi:3'-5' exoribonuclease
MTTTHTNISDLTISSMVEGAYLIQDIQLCATRAGAPYLRATLSDATGSIAMVCWDYDGDLSPANNGSIVNVTGQVNTFRDAMQLCVEELDLANLCDWDASEVAGIVPAAPVDVDAYCALLSTLVDSISTPDIHDICDYLFYKHWSMFCTIPAGKSIHHAFLHGLLMHTVDMAIMANALSANKPNAIHRDLLLAGTLLHDIGKVLEFEISPVTGMVTGYSKRGNLIGHSVLGAMEVADAADTVGASEEVSLLLQHMLLAHHGDPATGAAAVPMTVEAEILHDLDMLDSRRQICTENLSRVQPGEYSPYVSVLNRKIYRHEISKCQPAESQYQEDQTSASESSASVGEPADEPLRAVNDHPPCSEPVDPEFRRCTKLLPDGTLVPGVVIEGMFYPDDPYAWEF